MFRGLKSVIVIGPYVKYEKHFVEHCKDIDDFYRYCIVLFQNIGRRIYSLLVTRSYQVIFLFLRIFVLASPRELISRFF